MQLPIRFLVCGIALKVLLVVVWRFSQAPEVLTLLTEYDPLAFLFAEKGVSLFFDPRRIVPSAAEGLFFELLLVVAFGIECMIVGFVARSIIRRIA